MKKLTLIDAFIRLKDIPESDIKKVGFHPNRDVAWCKLKNHRIVELTGIELCYGMDWFVNHGI